MIVRKFQCWSNWRSDEVNRGRMVSLSYEILPPHPTLALLKKPPILIFKLCFVPWAILQSLDTLNIMPLVFYREVGCPGIATPHPAPPEFWRRK